MFKLFKLRAASLVKYVYVFQYPDHYTETSPGYLSLVWCQCNIDQMIPNIATIEPPVIKAPHAAPKNKTTRINSTNATMSHLHAHSFP